MRNFPFVCAAPVALAIVLVMAGCGGKSSQPQTTVPTPPPPPPANPGPITAANLVTLGGGGSVSGVDIVVPAPASPVTNAQDLGVTTGTGGSAFNTGDLVHRGATVNVLMFGPGLAGDMQVSISGPADISVSGVQAIMSTNKTPGVEFQITVNNNADLGARTVILQSPDNNLTTFTGGLEVVP